MMDQFKRCQVCITLELKNNKRFVHTVWFLTLRWRSQEIQFSFLEPQESLIWIGCTVHCMANNVLENPELFRFRQAPLKNHYRNEAGRKTSLKSGVSSWWPSSLCCPLQKTDEMTIGKTRSTYISNERWCRNWPEVMRGYMESEVLYLPAPICISDFETKSYIFF